ncbi:MAG: aspartate-semialdehyde dehydrogenase, partial [Nitrospinota bacterium]
EELREDSFTDIDIAFFSMGSSLSKQYAPFAVKAGAIVIDNSNAFRMEDDVPLVVPEVNAGDLNKHRGIIANPNCSTIQMAVPLKPVYDRAGIKRIVVSTYQSVSGTGKTAVTELENQTKALLQLEEPISDVYPYRIAFNCLPHIDDFMENGYTREEMKMVNETKKIFGDESITVSATTVRVPVFYCHSESINVETNENISAAEVRDILEKAPGVQVVDDPKSLMYPIASIGGGQDQVFVGRIRDDISIQNGINMWTVADNIRKGAALNAVQIAELVK